MERGGLMDGAPAEKREWAAPTLGLRAPRAETPRVGASRRARGVSAPTPTPRPRPRVVGRGSEPHSVPEVSRPSRPLPAPDRAHRSLAPTRRGRALRGNPLPTATSRRGQDMPRRTRNGAGSWTGLSRRGGSGRPRRSACGRRPGVRAEGRSLTACPRCLGPRAHSPFQTARTVPWLRPVAAVPCAVTPFIRPRRVGARTCREAHGTGRVGGRGSREEAGVGGPDARPAGAPRGNAEGRSLPACARCRGPRAHSPPATARRWPRVGASQRARGVAAPAPTPRSGPRAPFPGSDPTRPCPAR